jgi:hypothetical protein
MPDPDVWIDLAAVFATAYERGRFGRRIDYRAPVPIPCRDEDNAWIRATVEKK